MKTITLTQGKYAIVDDEIFEIINQVKWYAQYSPGNRSFYVVRGIKLDSNRWHLDRLHWWVIGRPLKGLFVDHINGNTLDNRRSNLRIVSNRENQSNQKRHRSGKLVGSRFNKKTKKWSSKIRMNGKEIYLGYFSTEIEAHQAYLSELNLKRGESHDPMFIK